MAKKTYIIAEAGVNHNGSVERALEMINIAARAGVDAVKFQTFKSEKVISRFAPKARYQIKTTDPGESQLDMARKLEFNEDKHLLLIRRCKERKVDFLSTPFDLDSIDLLVKLKVTNLKIPSGEITNVPHLVKAASTGMPIILSTGMSTLGEVELALGVLAFGYTKAKEVPSLDAFRNAFCSKAGQKALRDNITLLHCTTEYPAPFSDVNLWAIATMSSAFGLPVGLSDHTHGIAVSIAAVARGAIMIEKHFTLDKNLPGPDHKASLEPDELASLVKCIRQVEQALGSSIKMPAESEGKNLSIVRKSLVAAKNIRKGEVFTEDNLTVKRPGTGISPLNYWEFMGKKSERDYKEDEVIFSSRTLARR
jgi:N-acetylneuraminate synthase